MTNNHPDNEEIKRDESTDAAERLEAYLAENRSFGAFDAMALRTILATRAQQQRDIEALEAKLASIAFSLGSHNPACIPEMIEKLKAELADWAQTSANWESEAIHLQAKLELAREGLRHYADRLRWDCRCDSGLDHIEEQDAYNLYYAEGVDGKWMNGFTIAAATLDGIEKEK